LKESSETELASSDGLRNAPKNIMNMQHKISYE
jgi:hypothetical protein